MILVTSGMPADLKVPLSCMFVRCQQGINGVLSRALTHDSEPAHHCDGLQRGLEKPSTLLVLICRMISTHDQA